MDPGASSRAVAARRLASRRSSRAPGARRRHRRPHRPDDASTIADALGGSRCRCDAFWNGEALDRLLDAAHAASSTASSPILVANGWEVVPEATFNRFGERGSIDVLAWHPGYGAC